MNNLNWEAEHERFMTIAYARTMTAAKRAFYGWHTPEEGRCHSGMPGEDVGFMESASNAGQEPRTHDLWTDQVRHLVGQI